MDGSSAFSILVLYGRFLFYFFGEVRPQIRKFTNKINTISFLTKTMCCFNRFILDMTVMVNNEIISINLKYH